MTVTVVWCSIKNIDLEFMRDLLLGLALLLTSCVSVDNSANLFDPVWFSCKMGTSMSSVGVLV